MAKQNSINLDVTPELDGFKIAGGTTPREIKVSGGNVEIKGSGSAEISIPISSGSDEFVLKAHTQTLTNKRITPRVSTEESSATPTINTDNVDAHSITALATNITSMTTNLSGTPTNFQRLLIRIKDNGTARTIAWGTSFEDGTATLPTTTVLGKTLLVGLIYDSVDSKWACEATGSRA
jgi:hypothetical protein